MNKPRKISIKPIVSNASLRNANANAREKQKQIHNNRTGNTLNLHDDAQELKNLIDNN